MGYRRVQYRFLEDCFNLKTWRYRRAPSRCVLVHAFRTVFQSSAKMTYFGMQPIVQADYGRSGFHALIDAVQEDGPVEPRAAVALVLYCMMLLIG